MKIFILKKSVFDVGAETWKQIVSSLSNKYGTCGVCTLLFGKVVIVSSNLKAKIENAMLIKPWKKGDYNSRKNKFNIEKFFQFISNLTSLKMVTLVGQITLAIAL